MPELTYAVVSSVLGWISGKAYVYLQQGTAGGRFTVQQWLTLIGVVIALMVFAKFGIGMAVRHYKMSDFFVVGSTVCMFAIFVLVAFRGTRH